MNIAALEKIETLMEMLMYGYDLVTITDELIGCETPDDCGEMPMFESCGWIEIKTELNEDLASDHYCLPNDFCGMEIEEMGQSTAIYC